MEELLKELDEIKQKMANIGKKIVEIEKKIEEEEKNEKSRRWKPQKDDIYWFVSNSGCVGKSKWDNDGIDRERYLIGNYYRTEEECRFIREKLKVIAELKEFAEPKDRAWNGENHHYFFYYNCPAKRVDVSHNDDCMCRNIYFESVKKAQQALDTVGEERIKKYYLEVEE